MFRRTFLAGALATASAPLASRMAFAQAKKVKLGFVPNSDFLPSYVAKEKGFFAARNLDVTLEKIGISSNIPPALVSGSLDIGISTATVLLQIADAGLDMVVIAGSSRFNVKNPVASLVVRKDLDVKTPADLKGKKIGVPGFNSIIDVVVRKWLLDKGLKISDVTIVEAPFAQMRDLLAGKTIDVVAALEPIKTRIVADGTGTAVFDYYYDVAPDSVGAFWMATRAWADANKESIKSFREALDEAQTWIGSNAAEAEEIEKKYVGFASPKKPFYATKVSAADIDFYKGVLKAVSGEPKADSAKLIYP